MKNDRLFDALVESTEAPSSNAGGAISADDLQAFEKRIVESINTKLTERLDKFKREETARQTQTETKVETVTTENNESEDNENGKSTD